MISSPLRVVLAVAALAGVWACRAPADGFERVLFEDPMDAGTRVLDEGAVRFDATTSADGGGSWRVDAEGPSRVSLFEVDRLGVKNANLAYRASLRTEDLDGRAYLEMWCDATGRGEVVTRDLQSAPTGTTDWSEHETLCFLEEGQHSDAVRLGLVVEGPGRVWIDGLRLVREAS